MDPGRDVWVVQALGQPTGNLNGGLVPTPTTNPNPNQALGQATGNLNGGLMLFGRYWLHAATERALVQRAGMEARLYLLWLY